MAATPLPDSLETERLLLRPLAADDLDFFVALHGDPVVVRYLGGNGQPREPEVTREWLAKMLRWYREDQIGPYAIVRKSDERLVGRAGMSFFEFESNPSTPDGVPLAAWGKGSLPAGVEVERHVEVGYVVHPDYQRNGYATEAAARWVRYALEERGEPQVISLIHADNTPSLRVAAKNGLEATDKVRMEGSDYLVFKMRSPDWSKSANTPINTA